MVDLVFIFRFEHDCFLSLVGGTAFVRLPLIGNKGKTDMRFLHSMVRVKNLEAALKFYCGGLGLIEGHRMENEQGRFTLVYLVAPLDIEQARQTHAPLLELTYNWDEEEYKGGRNFGHLAFEVDDIYALCQKLMDDGVTINRPPRDGRMAFIRSPDGISIELLQKGDAKKVEEPWASMENIGEW
jgi:lactoylglutathione lyase